MVLNQRQKQPPEVFCKKRCSQKFLQDSQENTCARVSFLIKLQALSCNFIKKETLAQVVACEFCKITKNTFFIEHLQATACAKMMKKGKKNSAYPKLVEKDSYGIDEKEARQHCIRRYRK